jgi:hypothetical protein|uniref:YtxH-like protein n=1 Tax=Myoviridae sp. ctkfK18 TaxID=2825165 RepID=A0A8S5VHG9_9CAUD|nr:MAG TPA: YtxH-like protein [Myoviridae sp. ctkfK18]
MLKGLLVGLGVLIVGAAIYQHKKEKEFDENINNITRQTVDNITREMDRMTQETVQNINQFMQQQIHNM